MAKCWALLAALALLCLLAHAPVARADTMEGEIAAWMDAEGSDDGLQQMLLEAETELNQANQLAGASDADAEAEIDAEMDIDMEADTDRAGKMIAMARAHVAAGPSGPAFALAQKAAAAAQAQAVQAKAAPPAARPLTPHQQRVAAQPRAPNGRWVKPAPPQAKPAPPQQKPGVFARLAAGAKAMQNKVVAGAQKAVAGVKKGLAAVLAKNPKLAAIGQKIGNKLKSISTDIKAKLKTALAKAKTPEEKQKAILEAKTSAKQAKKAAIKVATKAAKKAEANKAEAKNKADAKKPEAKKPSFADKIKAGLKAGAKKLGAKIQAGVKKVVAKAKAGAKTLGAKAKAGAKKLAAKAKAIKNKLKAAVKSGNKKLAAKLKKAAKKVALKVKKAAAKVKNAVKKALKGKKGKAKLSKAQRKAQRAARKAARKARRAARKNKPPRSSSKKPRDASGRFIGRYKRPVHTKGKLKGKLKAKKHMSKKERKALKLQRKLAKLAKKALAAAKKKSKVAKADFKFEKAKLGPMRKKARALAKKAAKEVKHIHKLRQQAAMGGPKAQAELAAAQIRAAAMQKEAIEAQGAFRTQRNKVKGLRAAHRAQRKAVREAHANMHENGFDELLSKVNDDVDKLDQSLFGKKSANMKGFRKLSRSVEVPSAKYPGQWERKDMEIVERVPTRRVKIMAELDVPDPSRPGFTMRKLTQTVRKVPANLPLATRPVTILTRKEKRPYVGPDGKIIPVDVTYQVATQTVRAKSNGGTPAGFTQQEVQPPAESGLVYKEVTREFPTLINGHIRNLPFKVATWSKTSIVLKDVKGRQIASLKVKEVKDGASPISVKPLRSSPRQVDGKWVVSVIKQVPVKTRRGLMLKNAAIDIPATSDVIAGKAPKFKIRRPAYKPAKTKLKVVLEGVDNSLAQQQARRVALKAVEEDIQDNAINGSISERHLKAGWAAHEEVDRVRENFYPFQDELAVKQLIRPEHRFID